MHIWRILTLLSYNEVTAPQLDPTFYQIKIPGMDYLLLSCWPVSCCRPKSQNMATALGYFSELYAKLYFDKISYQSDKLFFFYKNQVVIFLHASFLLNNSLWDLWKLVDTLLKEKSNHHSHTSVNPVSYNDRICVAKYAPRCNRGTTVIVLTKNFLTRLRPALWDGTYYWYC